jgi:hypothetical protein
MLWTVFFATVTWLGSLAILLPLSALLSAIFFSLQKGTEGVFIKVINSKILKSSYSESKLTLMFFPSGESINKLYM